NQHAREDRYEDGKQRYENQLLLQLTKRLERLGDRLLEHRGNLLARTCGQWRDTRDRVVAESRVAVAVGGDEATGREVTRQPFSFRRRKRAGLELPCLFAAATQ